jgi:hypothetical protein
LAGSPLAAHAAVTVPSTFEAEDFDQGGNGVGYYDKTNGNQGDAGYRTGEDVDIFVSNDTAGGGRIVKNFENGEWLAYTISVPTAGNYDMELRVATNDGFPNSSYYVVVDDVKVTDFIVLPNHHGWDRFAWEGKRTLALTAGTHVLKIVSVQPYFALNSIRITATIPSTPYYGTPIAVPGEFEAEAFDRGGEGIAYHDTTPGNEGGAGFRDGEDVDIAVSDDAGSGSPYVVLMSNDREWLAYTISVASGGNYDLEMLAQAHAGGGPTSTYHVEVDGIDVTGHITLGVAEYWWIGRATLALTSGTHTVKLFLEGPWPIKLNSVRITPTGSAAPTPRAIPGVVEAEDFDTGGEGPAYHDNTPGNQGNAGFRTAENVDIFSSNDAGSGSWYVVKNFEAGEWLTYTINVPEGGNYDIELRASTSVDFPSAYHVVVDGANVTGSVALPDTGGWDNYRWLGKRTVSLTAGVHWLAIVVESPYFGFNSFRVLRSSP